MHLVFISSILTLRHTSLYPESPTFWPSKDPFVPRSNETYSPVGCSGAETLQEIHKAFSWFHREIIATVARREPNIFVISPLAVSIAMSLVTSQPVEQDTPEDEYRNSQVECLQKMGVQPVIDYVNGYASTGLSMAGAVFVTPKVDLRPEFIGTVTKTFRAPLRRLNFEESTERQNFITVWGKGKTQSLVNKDTSVALVNVIRYKGEWFKKFDVSDTLNSSRTDEDGKEIIVTSMQMRGIFLHGFYPAINANFIELPLKSQGRQKHMSMFFIIPNYVGTKSSPLFDISHHMANISIDELKSYGNLNQYFVSIPKFKIESTIDVRSAVESMTPGNSIFTQETTKLKHIAATPNLVGDKFVQRTSIEINEDGVEALTIDTSPDPPPVPASATPRGWDPQAFYVLLVTGSKTPQIIFSGRSYN